MPVKLERTQKLRVTVTALAVPHPKSATLNPSIRCEIFISSDDVTEYADNEVASNEFVNPTGATEDCCKENYDVVEL